MSRKAEARSSRTIARLANQLATTTAGLQRAEAERIGRFATKLARPSDGSTTARSGRKQRAFLIINSKSGTKGDSMQQLPRVLEALKRVGIDVDVRVKYKKSIARKDARRAAKAGYRLVIAAGGDGTVGAVARGLIGTSATLGILPLGTNNNTATTLGVPSDLNEACALLAAGAARWIDVGRVRPTGHKAATFLEMAFVGLPAVLTEAGQHVEKGRWDAMREALPSALTMEPTLTRVVLDDSRPEHLVRTLFVVIANGPRAGAGLTVVPRARLDDGMLDVHVFEDQDQRALAARLIEARGSVGDVEHAARRAQARRVRIEAVRPLPIVADSKPVGTTPATFDLYSHAVRVVVGSGMGLAWPVADAALDILQEAAHAAVSDSEEHAPEPVATRRAVARVLPIAAAAIGGGLLGGFLRKGALRP